jgi:hypothetical protein
LQGTIRMFSRVDNGVARSTSRAPLADMGVGADRSRVFQGNTRVTRPILHVHAQIQPS